MLSIPKKCVVSVNNGLSKAQNQVLSELEKLAKKAGLKTSAGKLVFAGLKLKSGECRLRRENWLVVDRQQPFEDQLELFRRALGSVNLEPGLLKGLPPGVMAILAPGEDA